MTRTETFDAVKRWLVNPRWRVAIALCILGLTLTWFTLRVADRFNEDVYIDWKAFYNAAHAARVGGDPIAASSNWYIYPPLLAGALNPLTHLAITPAAWVWYGLALATTLACMTLFYLVLCKRLNLPVRWSTFLPLLAWPLLLQANSVRWQFEQSQTDWLLLACFVVALATLDRVPWVCGLALGFAANIKYTALVALPYLLIRRRFKEAAWTAVGCALFAFLPALVMGWQTNQHLLSASLSRLADIGRQPESNRSDAEFRGMFSIVWWKSVSIPSFAARVQRDVDAGKWVLPAIVGTVAAGCVLVAWRAYRRAGVNVLAGRSPRADWSDPRDLMPGVLVLEWLGGILVGFDLGPQMTPRHTFVFLPITMTCCALIACHRPGGPMVRLIVALILPLIGSALGGMWPSRDSLQQWPNYCSTLGWGWLGCYLILVGAMLRWLTRPPADRAT